MGFIGKGAGGEEPHDPVQIAVAPERENRVDAIADACLGCHTDTEAAGKAESESIENSILAAIAEAVDVLVEDSGGDKSKSGDDSPPKAAAEPPAAPQAKRNARSEPEPGAEGGDIGDEIQRIIASYNRDREDEPPA